MAPNFSNGDPCLQMCPGWEEPGPNAIRMHVQARPICRTTAQQDRAMPRTRPSPAAFKPVCAHPTRASIVGGAGLIWPWTPATPFSGVDDPPGDRGPRIEQRPFMGTDLARRPADSNRFALFPTDHRESLLRFTLHLISSSQSGRPTHTHATTPQLTPTHTGQPTPPRSTVDR